MYYGAYLKVMHLFVLGLHDLSKLLVGWRGLVFLGGMDIKQRYRRSSLGPFWITIATAVNVAGLALVFGTVFDIPLREYVPFLSCGLVLWSYLTTSIVEANDLFVNQRSILLESRFSPSYFIGRLLVRNFYIFCHNFLVLLAVMVIFSVGLSWTLILAILGIFIFTICIYFLCNVFAIFSTRFRDLPPIIASVLQLGFYVTPIIWSPSIMDGRHRVVFVELNPVFHLIEIVRGPMLGQVPEVTSYLVSIVLLLLLLIVNLLVVGRYRHRLSFWV